MDAGSRWEHQLAVFARFRKEVGRALPTIRAHFPPFPLDEYTIDFISLTF